MKMDEPPSKIATNWGSRTLRKSKRHIVIVEGTDDVEGSRRGTYEDKNMDLVDIENIEEVRKRATTMNNKRILINRYKEKTIDRGFVFNDVINTRITKMFLRKYNDYSAKINFIDKILRRIEGKFGFIVLSYFRFVWWLFLVNLFGSILIIFFIILPQAFMPSINFLNEDLCKNYSSYEPKDLCLNGNLSINVKRCLDFKTCYYTQGYLTKLQMNNKQTTWWKFVDFLQGTGWMEETFLFLGSYTNKMIPIPYNMQVAILLITAIYFFIFLFSMASYSSSSIQQRITSHRKITHLSPDSFPAFLLAEKLFNGWDFTIIDPTKASCKQYQLKNFFVDMYQEYINFGQKKSTLGQKLILWMVRLSVNILIIILIIISLTAIVVSIVKQEEILTDDIKRNSALKLLCSFIPAFTVVFFKTVMPLIFNKLIEFEKYSSEKKLNLMLIRSVIITLASVMTLVISVGARMLCDQQPCDKDILCWETYIGQQLYKLSLVDFFMDIATFFVEFIRKRVVDRFPNNHLLRLVGVQEFDVPRNIIDVINKQTVCWLGVFVAPGLPLINTMKFFVQFFLKFLTLTLNCKPSKEQRTFESSYFFVVILLITFFICSSLNAFAVGRVLPSPSCGPFRVYEYPHDYMSQRISRAIETYFSAPVRTFVLFMGSWMFFIIVLIVLCLILLYYQSLIAGNKKLARNLKEQLSSMQADNLTYKKEMQALRQRSSVQDTKDE